MIIKHNHIYEGEQLKKKTVALGTVSAALLLIAATAAPASADPRVTSCTTTGASGWMLFDNYTSAQSTVTIKFELTDTKADGHHARIRLVTKTSSGAIVNWPWRKNTSGMGTEVYRTTAQDSRGIAALGIETARFEKETKLNYCNA